MASAKTICVVTGSRAEYGILFWTMREILESQNLELQLIATGTHLSDDFGHTADVIREDGFTIDEEVEVLSGDDGRLGMATSISRGVEGLATALSRLGPDCIMVLGDRTEILAAAIAATALGIPIAHLHGGESSEGAIDESIRHAVTKMSHLHFAAMEPFARRIIQMGEDARHVHVVGAPGLENFLRLELSDRDKLSHRTGIDLAEPFLLVTYHPATLGKTDPVSALEQLFGALSQFPEMPLLMTKSNADAGGRKINERLEMFAAEHPGRVALISNLGQEDYLGAMREAEVVIGNSSSGLIEAPAAKTPTVNVGPRQDGRLRAASVIDCLEESTAIEGALRQALDPSFRNSCFDEAPPYGQPSNASQKIVSLLQATDLENVLIKKFHDLTFQNLEETP